jgi:putative addiction module component (TIGR02574 family)
MSAAVSNIDDAYSAAQALAPLQKLELISRLWEDVRESGQFRPSDNDLAVIKQRWADYEAGRETAAPWEQVRDEVRRKIASHEET